MGAPASPLPGMQESFAEEWGQVVLDPGWPGTSGSELTLESRGRTQRGDGQFHVQESKSEMSQGSAERGEEGQRG